MVSQTILAANEFQWAPQTKNSFVLPRGWGGICFRRGAWSRPRNRVPGGWIAKSLTDVAGSSQWFSEGFVTYSNAAKIRRLGVPRSVLASEGAVSEAVARAMAEGALGRAGAQLAVAVTGIAGPDGAVPGKPVGTVWLCWAEQRGGRIRLSAQLQALSRRSRKRATQDRASGSRRLLAR